MESSKEENSFGGVLYRAREIIKPCSNGRNAKAGTNKRKKILKRLKKKNVLLIYIQAYLETKKNLV